MIPLGTRVRLSRDETLYPSVGTWPRYRGKPGVVVIHNEADQEYGVQVGATHVPTRPDTGGLAYDHDQVSWFKEHELRVA